MFDHGFFIILNLAVGGRGLGRVEGPVDVPAGRVGLPLDGEDVEVVGAPRFPGPTGPAGPPVSALPGVDPSDRPIVAWREQTGSFPTYDAYAARWDGTAWVRLNGTGFMGGAGLFNAGQNPANDIVPELVVDARGKIWVAWREGTAAQVWASNY